MTMGTNQGKCTEQDKDRVKERSLRNIRTYEVGERGVPSKER